MAPSRCRERLVYLLEKGSVGKRQTHRASASARYGVSSLVSSFMTGDRCPAQHIPRKQVTALRARPSAQTFCNSLVAEFLFLSDEKPASLIGNRRLFVAELSAWRRLS